MALLRSFGRIPLLLSSCRRTVSIKSCSVYSSQLAKSIPDRIQRRLAYHSFSSPRGLRRCRASVCYDGLFQAPAFISKPPGQFRQCHSSAQTLSKDWQLALLRLRNIKSPTSDQLVQFTEAVSPYLQTVSQLPANDPGLRSYAPFVARSLQHFAKHVSKNASLRENMKIYLQSSRDFLAWWYEAALKCMYFFNPIELSTFALYSHVHLDIAPPKRFLSLWDKVAMPAMDKFDAQSLSNILFAHGKFEIMPSESLLRLWYAVAAKRLSEFNEQDLSNTIYAFGLLGLKPEIDFLNRWYDCATPQLAYFTTQGLANSIYAHGKLQLMPRDDFLERWYDSVTPKLVDFKTQELANSIYTFGKLKLMPGEDFLRGWYDAALTKLQQFSTQHLSNSFYAFSQFGLKPRPDFLHAWYSAALDVLHGAIEQELSNIVYALSLLKLSPPAAFFKRWQDVATPRLARFTQQNLANSIYAIALLKLRPEDTFLKSFDAAVLSLIHAFNAQNLCSCIYALAKLNAKLSRVFIKRWCHRTAELSVSKLNGTELVHSLFGLSHLNVAVSTVLLKQLCATVIDRFEEDYDETKWLRMSIRIAKNYRGDDDKLRKNCLGSLYWVLWYHLHVDCSKWSAAEEVLEESLESGLTVADLFTSRLD